MAFHRAIGWSAKDDQDLKKFAANNVSPGVMASRLGRSEVSVIGRLRELEQPAKAVKSMRACMSCTKPFISDGPHNRLCGRCRTKEKTRFDF